MSTPSSSGTQTQRKANAAAAVEELTVNLKRYPPEGPVPFPSLFSTTGWRRNIYPYALRESQLERSETVELRVLRLSNEYLEVDVLLCGQFARSEAFPLASH